MVDFPPDFGGERKNLLQKLGQMCSTEDFSRHISFKADRGSA